MFVGLFIDDPTTLWLLFELGILFSKFIIKDRYNNTDIMHDAIDTKDKKEDKN